MNNLDHRVNRLLSKPVTEASRREYHRSLDKDNPETKIKELYSHLESSYKMIGTNSSTLDYSDIESIISTYIPLSDLYLDLNTSNSNSISEGLLWLHKNEKMPKFSTHYEDDTEIYAWLSYHIGFHDRDPEDLHANELVYLLPLNVIDEMIHSGGGTRYQEFGETPSEEEDYEVEDSPVDVSFEDLRKCIEAAALVVSNFGM